MIGSKLLWTGLTLIMAKGLLPIPAIEIVGAIIMILGLIAYWMDR